MRLIDADALIYSICKNDCGIESPSDCIMYANNCCLNVDIVRNAPTIGGWISVKDKLPEVGDRVLFTGMSSFGTRFCTQRGWFDGTFWKRDAGETVYSSTPVTHWMPLPEPPKEVSQDD